MANLPGRLLDALPGRLLNLVTRFLPPGSASGGAASGRSRGGAADGGASRGRSHGGASYESASGHESASGRDRNDSDRYGSDRYSSDRHGLDRYDSDRYDWGRYDWGRYDWGRAMRAEMAVLEGRGERWRFAGGCLRTALIQFHLLRTAVHLAVVLGTLGTVFAWAAAVDYRPLSWPIDAVVSVLAVVCWQARRAAMLGPLGNGAVAWLLRGCGYLLAAGIAAAALLHARPATDDEVNSGTGLLAVGVVVTAYALGLVLVCARPSVATTRLRLTAVGCGAVAALTWLLAVVIAPPIPTSTGWALALAATASVAALSMNLGTPRRALLAALLSAAITLALIFCAVTTLAHFGPDAVIPAITPVALPADRITESRVEIIDPYVLVLALGGIAATALAAAGVPFRRPTTAHRPTPAPHHPAGA